MQPHRLFCLCALFLLVFATFPSFANDAFRLPQDIQLSKQAVQLNIDPKKQVFSGVTTLHLSFTNPTYVISYHSKALDIKDVYLQYQGTRYPLTVQEPNQYEIVSHQVPVKLEDAATLHIQFSGKLSLHHGGLFSGHSGQEQAYLLTQFQSMEARGVFPTLDEPNKKSTFKFSVSTPIEYDVLHNTHVKSITEQHATKLTQFKTTPRINTDILSLAIGQFNAKPLDTNRFKSKVYVPKSISITLPTYFNQIVNASVSHIEEYLDAPFPFKKLDFIVGNYGSVAAMENLGLVSINYNQVPAPGATELAHCQFKKLIAHEVAHSWFGNDITMDWYDDYWLNESFTEFIAAKVIQDLYPNHDLCTYTPQSRAFKDDNSKAMPLVFDIKSRKDTLAYGQLHYTKGRALLEMLEQAMGEKSFQSLLRRYVDLYHGQNVSTEQFIKLLKDPNLQNVTSSFTRQTGYPLVTLTKNDHQFFIEQKDLFNRSEQLWTIPVSLKVWDGRQISTHKLILSKHKQKVALNKDIKAVFLDGGGVGYFRFVNQSTYEDIPIHKLSRQEKSSFNDNLQALAITGHVDFMKYTQALVAELNSLQLGNPRADEIVSTLIDAYLEHVQIKSVSPYTAYLRKHIKLNIQWQQTLEMPYGNNLMKLYGVYMQDPNAVNAAKRIYQSGQHIGHPHLDAIVMTLAKNSTNEEYKSLIRDFITIPTTEKEAFLSGLGYVNSVSKTAQYYDLLLSDKTQGMVIDYRFQFPIFNPALRISSIQLINARKDKIFNHVSSESLQWFPYNFLLACSDEQKEAIHQLFESWQSISGLKSKLSIVSDGIEQCTQNSERIGKSILAASPH
ncbi:M1 family aminopeptidase [Pseudoalteromonas luteoviolacea]|uniref:Aminopeptidase N n=1 Tax=Pseudoalteromonas luteoviolacea S4060-1 TaxID=1365257 RepID=A0A167JKQ6_9GAMM|nr:M1 family aminopeptidase [Pseudoalteromonas luteoviolacea]KZN61261.1 hypothetical protein N478_04150 [Pseudoalteromonas luteoviolacea S4060-1]